MRYYRFMEDVFHWTDLFIVSAYILIIYIIAIFIRGAYINKYSEYKYLLWAITSKFVGVLGFAFMYLSYYKGGDTMYYFNGSRILNQIFMYDTYEYFRFMFSSHNFEPDLMYIRQHILYSKSAEEWFLMRFTSPIVALAFNRYLVAQVVMAFISVAGAWKLFQTFLIFSPKKQKEAFIAVFLVPSVVLWGSGLLKDTVAFAFLSIFLYYSVKAFYLYQFKIKYFVFILLSAYIVFNVKSYILISIIPVLSFGWIAFNRHRIKSRFFRQIITPLIIPIALLAGYALINSLQEQSEKYAFENLQKRSEGFHMWHAHQGGAVYDLGEIEYTAIGLIKKVPFAINVTFFRPYLTEIFNVGTAIAGIESFISLIFFVLLLYWYKLRWLKTVFSNPILLISFLFALIIGYVAGFNSYNFGALSRYKIPAMPFFAYILMYFYYEHKAKKKVEKDKKNEQQDIYPT